MANLTIDQKRDLCALSDARLDGERAAVCGALEPFALVISLEDSTKRAYYAWETVARIVAERRSRFDTLESRLPNTVGRHHA